ncbi:MAG: carboxylating nicotinate-nucleotide diphosphorylase [Nitrospirae bacterium]|nr:carboxylating nicotinate-nucleotide diphosphorylase [Nitrospirota bacterium]
MRKDRHRVTEAQRDKATVDSVLRNALNEDIGTGDITTLSIVPEKDISKALIIAKEDFILAGLSFAERTFKLVNKDVKFKAMKRDGSKIKKGTVIAEINGNTRSILMAERTALNLLQRLSGIATLTSKFVRRVAGLPVKILDTRKTTPGLRFFEKYAVKMGGGCNHRYGLFDGMLIKDNHIAAAGGLKKTVKLARSSGYDLFKIEVEAKSIKEVKEALSSGADIIMLDNMSVDEMIKAVKIIRFHKADTIIEASGNVNLENVRAIAETGVDMISVGALTHSAPASDISMKIGR